MELNNQSGYNLYISGTADIAARGVGLIMQRDVAKPVKCFHPISDRVMRVDLMTDRGVLSIVVGYAPTEQSESERPILSTVRFGHAKDRLYGDCFGGFQCQNWAKAISSNRRLWVS